MGFYRKKDKRTEKKQQKELHFGDIDFPLRQHLMLQFVWAFVFALLSVIIGITFTSFSLFALGFSAALLWFTVSFYKVQKCLSGQMYMYEGVCVDLHYRAKHSLGDMDFLVIRLADDKILKLSAHDKRDVMKVRLKDIVKVYSYAKHLSTMNGNTYTLPSYSYLCTTGYCDPGVTDADQQIKKES